ncbi:MAG: tryptophan synthase subunit alpha [Kangiellaceae bacterium]|jgi:tryptophan synthase alpha chain|nr:tryptophan synthase subunit alpha [Kangiellaceae bacterium]
MTRYAKMFEQTSAKDAIAFIPFVMLGDPNAEQCLAIIDQLIASGADGLELGIPFSDPVADGPVIQAASIRALDQGMTPEKAFELLATVRQRHPDVAIGLLLYSNLVYRAGIDKFYQNCSEIGIDSVLIADVPIREAQRFDDYSQKYNVDAVHILPPRPSDDTLQKVAQFSKGYTYVLGRAGVTGTNVSAEMPTSDIMEKLAQHQAAPSVMGFGISTPQHVADAKSHGFSGVISGSAVVSIIARHIDDDQSMLSELGEFVKEMKRAC